MHRRSWRGASRSKCLDEGAAQPRTLALFPDDRCEGVLPDDVDRAAAAVAAAAVPAAAVGRVLAGADAVARSCSWIGSGPSGCRRAARARAGIRCCWFWWPTGCWRRAASGVCTVSGSSAARWRILLGADVALAEIHKLYRLPRPAARAQAGAVRSSGGALAGSVQCPLRRAAVRSDQHLFRGQSAVPGRRQAPLWLLARSSAGLRAGGDRAWW